MRYWWVNQNQTYNYEVPGGFLWSPKTKSNGARNPFYDSMTSLVPGDVIFSFADTLIKAIGIVQRTAVTAPKPDFRTAGSNWSDTGWYVEVEFSPVQRPIRPKEFMANIGPLLADKYAPLLHDGRGKQNLYVTEISDELASLLLALSQVNLPLLTMELAPVQNPDDDAAIETEIHLKQLEGDPEGIQIVKSRRGQGLFRANVRLVEGACRVTGVASMKHLRASHIKPWAASTNEEKLDGYNGLLLAPHVDHLFDRGFITFTGDGQLLVSKELNPVVLAKWHIDASRPVGGFKAPQRSYLEYHKENIFQG